MQGDNLDRDRKSGRMWKGEREEQKEKRGKKGKTEGENKGDSERSLEGRNI